MCQSVWWNMSLIFPIEVKVIMFLQIPVHDMHIVYFWYTVW